MELFSFDKEATRGFGYDSKARAKSEARRPSRTSAWLSIPSRWRRDHVLVPQQTWPRHAGAFRLMIIAVTEPCRRCQCASSNCPLLDSSCSRPLPTVGGLKPILWNRIVLRRVIGRTDAISLVAPTSASVCLVSPSARLFICGAGSFSRRGGNSQTSTKHLILKSYRGPSTPSTHTNPFFERETSVKGHIPSFHTGQMQKSKHLSVRITEKKWSKLKRGAAENELRLSDLVRRRLISMRARRVSTQSTPSQG